MPSRFSGQTGQLGPILHLLQPILVPVLQTDPAPLPASFRTGVLSTRVTVEVTGFEPGWKAVVPATSTMRT